MDDKTLEPQYEKLLKACPMLSENQTTLGRRWCDLSAYLNPITRKYNNYLKRLDGVLTNKRFLGKFCHFQDYFLTVDPLTYRNDLNNPYNTYHPNMYHRKAKEEELDASIPYLRHAVQPFLEGLLDSAQTISQYCAQNDRHGWYRLFLWDDKFASYSEVFPEIANGFKIVASATPWSILVPGMNKFYTSKSHPSHTPPLGT